MVSVEFEDMQHITLWHPILAYMTQCLKAVSRTDTTGTVLLNEFESSFS